MRGNAESHQMVAPGSLAQVLEMLATSPGKWTPIAGGTELMVAHAAGRLAPSSLVSLWALPELRTIRIAESALAIGAAATFTDIRLHATVNEEFPLLAKAASWIGSIANQNRATLGGNLANGSPAADSSPALLAYDAELELVSVRGKRRVAYRDFHSGYKRNILADDELILTVYLPRRFQQHRQYLRKVGTRRAMAISKAALAGTARLENGRLSEIRLAAASVAAYPTRLYRAEDSLQGQLLDQPTIHKARAAMLAELVPIDDIRSTAEYRTRVTVNLLEEFLTGLLREPTA